MNLAQEDLPSNSEDQEEAEADLEDCRSDLKRVRRKVAQLDGDLRVLMGEFEKQQTFSQPSPSQQLTPAYPQHAKAIDGDYQVQ